MFTVGANPWSGLPHCPPPRDPNPGVHARDPCGGDGEGHRAQHPPPKPVEPLPADELALATPTARFQGCQASAQASE